MNSGTRLEQFTLFFLSLVAAVWFFVQYPSQDPRSAVDITYSKQEIKEKARRQWADLGYSVDDYTVDRISMVSKKALLDSLQLQWGRPYITKLLTDSTTPNLKPFVWQVGFKPKNNARVSVSLQPGSETDLGNENQTIQLYLDPGGEFTELLNNIDQLPQKKVNREALGMIFQADSLFRHPVMAAVSDSMLSRMLYFDMQQKYGPFANYSRTSTKKVRSSFARGIPHLHSKNDAQAMADFYLKKTGWDRASLKRDTVFIKRIKTVNAANVRYISSKPVRGQRLAINVVVSPTGALLGLQSEYNPSPSLSTSNTSAWNILQAIAMFLFLLGIFVTFFFRMRARTIDTKSALMVAILMGFIMLVSQFLGAVSVFKPFSSGNAWDKILVLFIGFGFIGAFVSISSFVLYAVSDSLTRQYWSQKLSSYDYLLQGWVFNKPVGVVTLRSVALAFILAGIWTFLLQLFPGLYFEISNTFLSDHTVWSPLYLILHNSWVSFSILFSIFLIIGSRAFGQSRNRWVAGAFMVAACAVAGPVIHSYGPAFHDVAIGACVGLVLTIIYMKWDFLTLLLSHFLFLGLVGSATGWIIPHSPDFYIFLSIIGLMGLLLTAGAFAAFMGKDERSLGEYVPGYVEELAQEQRIKQELHIAREVQQSFLPSRMPDIAGLDVAAICHPAYETGGDYYDFIPLDDHRLALAIGDVSGKGIQAAFYMTLVKGMLHSLCRESESPAEVLRKANRLFYDNAVKGIFISLIYGVIDLKKQTFTFARAGHNPILHVQVSSGKVEALQPTGLGLGLTKGEIFDNKISEIELSITEDDLFLLYTDGIVEALNPAHQFFGDDRLTAVIKKQRSKSASTIVSVISKKVVRFIGKAKQHDDMTLLAIRFKKDE